MAEDNNRAAVTGELYSCNVQQFHVINVNYDCLKCFNRNLKRGCYVLPRIEIKQIFLNFRKTP